MRSNLKVIKFSLTMLLFISSCGPKNEVNENIMEATIQAAVVATDVAQNEMDNSISEAVSATLTAIPSPTPVAVDQLSEEELAFALEQSADEAVSSADETIQYSTSATGDGELTQAEIDELYYLYYWSIEELEQALYLLDLYYDLYDELLEAVIVDLESIENELNSILSTAEDALVYLEEISETISNGEILAQEKLDQFEEFSKLISEGSSNISSQLPDWVLTRKDEINTIAGNALSISPDEVADTKRGAVLIANQYLNEIKLAIGDGKFSILELQSLSQLGANASASLGQFGGEFADFSNLINGITDSFARGQLPQINAGIGSWQSMIPTIR
jgi:hypothetical protein